MMTAVIVFLITYFFIATEKIDKTVAALLGSMVIALSGVVPYPDLLTCIDINVVFLLMGMMIIVGILSLTGVFEWLAIIIAQKSKGNGILIVCMFLIVTALISTFLNNVTTIILMAPITILITQMLCIPTVPILILEAIFSNIGGTATLVGDPPNILIASKTGLTFNQFIYNLTPVVIVVTIATLVVVILFLGKRYIVSDVMRSRIMLATPSKAIIDPKMLISSSIIFMLVIIGFFISNFFNVDAGVVALTGSLVMIIFSRVKFHDVVHMVEWDVILFFIGLFMIIGSLEKVGVFEYLGHHMMALTGGNLLLGAIVILWGSAIVSAIVDNIPLVIAMLPLIKIIIPEFAETLNIVGDEQIRTQIAEPLYWSLALGACLGGNGTLVGASANIVIAQLARRNHYKLSFWDFTKYGLPLMLLSLVICTVYIWLRYF